MGDTWAVLELRREKEEEVFILTIQRRGGDGESNFEGSATPSPPPSTIICVWTCQLLRPLDDSSCLSSLNLGPQRKAGS